MSQRGAAAGEQHRDQRGPMPGGVAAQAVGDGEQPAASAYAASWLSCRARPATGAKREQRHVISARRFPASWPAAAAQDASSFWRADSRPAAGQIRKTCGVPAYLRVVIEKHRTQASRTMNAEPAQAGTDRVN